MRDSTRDSTRDSARDSAPLQRTLQHALQHIHDRVNMAFSTFSPAALVDIGAVEDHATPRERVDVGCSNFARRWYLDVANRCIAVDTGLAKAPVVDEDEEDVRCMCVCGRGSGRWGGGGGGRGSGGREEDDDEEDVRAVEKHVLEPYPLRDGKNTDPHALMPGVACAGVACVGSMGYLQ